MENTFRKYLIRKTNSGNYLRLVMFNLLLSNVVPHFVKVHGWKHKEAVSWKHIDASQNRSFSEKNMRGITAEGKKGILY